MTAVSYKIMLYLYPPTYSHTQNFCLFKHTLRHNTFLQHFSTALLHNTPSLLLRTTKYYKVTLRQSDFQNDVRTTSIQYYSVLQSNTPTVRPPKGRQKTTSIKTTIQHYSVRQSTTKYYSDLRKEAHPVLLRTTKYYQVLLPTTKRPSSTTPYYKVLQKLPKPQLLKQQASKTSISCEASSTFQERSVENTSISCEASSTFQVRASKTRAFCAKLPQLFKQQASKTSISCEASSTFQVRSVQNEHFLRGFLKFSSKKLSKWAFRARLLQLFKQEAAKILRLPRKMRKRPLTLKVWSAKRAFRARLPIKPFFNSCETSYKAIFTIDDFVRVFP